MKTYKVAHTALALPSVILGLMRIAEIGDSEIQALCDTALASGQGVSTSGVCRT